MHVIQQRDKTMNKDQAKGSVKEAAGSVQKTAGRLTGSKEQELKGHARETSGKVQQKVGNLKEVLRESGKH
jgi:uncharacterized protein YjbJ (UPF0337 family)